jgi:hypothetical protein
MPLVKGLGVVRIGWSPIGQMADPDHSSGWRAIRKADCIRARGVTSSRACAPVNVMAFIGHSVTFGQGFYLLRESV